MKPRFRLLTTVLLLLAGLLVAPGCNSEFEGPLPRRDQFNYPIGLTFHPNGRYLYVVNSNFDARFRPTAGGTVSVVDLDSMQILAQNTPYVPSFGAKIELNDDASKAYVTARNRDVVVAYDVAADGSALFCTTDDGKTTSDPAACTIDQVDVDGTEADLPSDPFGLAVFTVERQGQPVDVVNLANLNSSRVATLSLLDRDIGNASLRTAPLLSGANAIAQRPGTQNLYVAGRNTNGVAIFQPYINDTGEVEAILQRGSFVLNHRTQQIDARGLAFNDAGDRLYVVARRPDALYTVKIVPSNPDTGTGTKNEVVSTVPLPDQPSDITLHTTPQGQRLAYITSYDDQAVVVVDLDSDTIVDEILLDASPYSIAIEPPTSGCSTPEQRCRAFVTLFDDTRDSAANCNNAKTNCGSVAIIDINPLHRNPDAPELSRYHTVISKIQ